MRTALDFCLFHFSWKHCLSVSTYSHTQTDTYAQVALLNPEYRVVGECCRETSQPLLNAVLLNTSQGSREGHDSTISTNRTLIIHKCIVYFEIFHPVPLSALNPVPLPSTPLNSFLSKTHILLLFIMDQTGEGLL